MRRRAFTLIELLVAVTIVGVLASLAIPKGKVIRRRAVAAQIVGDFDVIRHGVLSFYVDSGYFPKEAGSGKVPNGLAPYLPPTFTMQKAAWTLDYENWSLKKRPKYVNTGVVIGVSFTTADTALGQTAAQLMGNAPSFTVGKKYTFLISGF